VDLCFCNVELVEYDLSFSTAYEILVLPAAKSDHSKLIAAE